MFNNSKLKYSARVNYDVACPMHFEEYPMDTQRCNISFESWGHPCQVIYDTMRNLCLITSFYFNPNWKRIHILSYQTFQYIILTWLREKRKFSSSISLAQFDLDVNFIEDPLSNFSSLGKLFHYFYSFISRYFHEILFVVVRKYCDFLMIC